MKDEMAIPLMFGKGNKKNKFNTWTKERKLHQDNDDETSNILNDGKGNREILLNVREVERVNRRNLNIRENTENNRRINNENNNYSKCGLIFLSFAVQIFVYLLLLELSFDKIDFIKKYNNILFSFP